MYLQRLSTNHPACRNVIRPLLIVIAVALVVIGGVALGSHIRGVGSGVGASMVAVGAISLLLFVLSSFGTKKEVITRFAPFEITIATSFTHPKSIPFTQNGDTRTIGNSANCERLIEDAISWLRATHKTVRLSFAQNVDSTILENMLAACHSAPHYLEVMKQAAEDDKIHLFIKAKPCEEEVFPGTTRRTFPNGTIETFSHDCPGKVTVLKGDNKEVGFFDEFGLFRSGYEFRDLSKAESERWRAHFYNPIIIAEHESYALSEFEGELRLLSTIGCYSLAMENEHISMGKVLKWHADAFLGQIGSFLSRILADKPESEMMSLVAFSPTVIARVAKIFHDLGGQLEEHQKSKILAYTKV